MEDGTIDLGNTAILAVVAPTPDQLAEAHISAQMLEDDRQIPCPGSARSHEAASSTVSLPIGNAGATPAPGFLSIQFERGLAAHSPSEAA